MTSLCCINYQNSCSVQSSTKHEVNTLDVIAIKAITTCPVVKKDKILRKDRMSIAHVLLS